MRYKPVTYTGMKDHLVKVKEDKIKAEEKEKARMERRREQRKCEYQPVGLSFGRLQPNIFP